MSKYANNRTEEHLENLSKSLKGKPKTPGFTGRSHSEETKKQMRNSHTGIIRGPYGPRGPQEKITCPYCDKSGGYASMKRWHFDNCR